MTQSEQTIYTGHFDTLGDLQSELEQIILAASAQDKQFFRASTVGAWLYPIYPLGY
jgi:hypothetical protein